jgi:hypothetical protein
MENNENINRLANKANEVLIKYEKWLLLLLVVLTALKLSVNFQIEILTVAAALFSGVLFFFAAFTFTYNSGLSEFDKFICKVIYWASSVSCVSIMYRLFNYPGSKLISLIALFSLTISLFILLIQKMRGKESEAINKSIVFRIIILNTIIIVLNFIKFKNLA